MHAALPLGRPLRVSRLPGLTLILGATGLAAIAGYLVIWLVPLRIGLAGYAAFGFFWAAMYLLVSALSGVQQEVTRATVPRPSPLEPRASPARNFGIVVAGGVFLSVVATAPLWVVAVFPEGGWSLVWPLAFAAASYVLVATLAGTLYGIKAWGPLAAMISVDALLRLLFVATVAEFTGDAAALAWAAAAPFLLTIVLLWPGFRSRVVGATALDVGYRSLTWNVARTVGAAASMGVLVSGLPVLIGIAAVGDDPATVAALFLAITITRAPVIVTVLSLQSYLVVRFLGHRATFWRDFLAVQAAIGIGGVLLAIAAWVWAPAVFDLLYRGAIDLPGWFYAVLVISSALVGSLAVSAPAVLALAQHLVYSLGWVVAALVTIGCFVLPVDLFAQTVTALIAGPVAGLAVHASYLVAKRASIVALD